MRKTGVKVKRRNRSGDESADGGRDERGKEGGDEGNEQEGKHM